MKNLLPTWGWATFGLIGALAGVLYLVLAESILTDTCFRQRQHCRDANHNF
jgi:hypothetical protein